MKTLKVLFLILTIWGVFVGCDSDSDIIKDDNTPQEPRLSWIGAVWSYVVWEAQDSLHNDSVVHYDAPVNYIRFTVLDKPETINGKTYYPLVKYSGCEYSPETAEAIYRIRQDGERIYMLKKDFTPQEGETRFLSSGGQDYILYDFGLETGDKWYKVNNADGSNSDVYIKNISSVSTIDGFNFRVFYSNVSDAIISEPIIDGIGSTYDLLNPCVMGNGFNLPTCRCNGYTLNYFRSADGSVVYKNPFASSYTGTTFVPDDCAICPSDGI